MARCAACGETILFGGVTQGDLRYCNTICQNKGRVIAAAAQVPESEAKSLAHQIHQGPCPRCKGPGPVDVHTSYWAWSALADAVGKPAAVEVPSLRRQVAAWQRRVHRAAWLVGVSVGPDLDARANRAESPGDGGAAGSVAAIRETHADCLSAACQQEVVRGRSAFLEPGNGCSSSLTLVESISEVTSLCGPRPAHPLQDPQISGQFLRFRG